MLTLEELKSITLERQGLRYDALFGGGKAAVGQAVGQLGYLQIDTLSVVERAHHHTLWTRIPDYKTDYLDELVQERQIFEYWFHAASYLPIRDYRFAQLQMLEVRDNDSHYYKVDSTVMQYIIDTIRAEGPKRARDFENQAKKKGSWWDWKPTKIALERLFLQGDLMVSGREGMQKTYDLPERVLPATIDLRMPSPMEFASYLVKTYLNAYGWTTVKQITHLKTGEGIRKDVNEVLSVMLEGRMVESIHIKGCPPVFVRCDLMEVKAERNTTEIRLLSPFDNAIIHRDRLKQFFDFDYRMECYAPKEKRQYGYFCLPILFGNTFVGRVDCKAHRKQQQFEIIHLHVENQSVDLDLWAKPFAERIKQFVLFNGCTSLKLSQVSPSNGTSALRKLLEGLF
ncbi:winged helix-turn-helix domain-containing protein [Sphingobacterium faecale]|uniref:YcaQ family DNA glycosylase n=1 Tax=Sphingobacterium faecale TaxID=2803775 RepID=A0ABS1R2R7_9SPHI|nr:crosslink repair DNA glycosylase YcaQ family protein [Sphingobacterium faecale]MBL1409006.1 YcaQ family DNA glycosylase [Sphingobacterium faecale]